MKTLAFLKYSEFYFSIHVDVNIPNKNYKENVNDKIKHSNTPRFEFMCAECKVFGDMKALSSACKLQAFIDKTSQQIHHYWL